MSKEKVSTQELIDLFSVRAMVSKRVAEEFVKMLLMTIESVLIAGDSVKIKDLGVFKLQWVKPRKSVNVNTKEEILLDGYYKVNFEPDAALKDLVNEPYAHLAAVNLDGSSPKGSQTNEEVADADSDDNTEEDLNESEIPDYEFEAGGSVDSSFDSLKVFEEQAAEIKSIISEIASLRPLKKTVEERPSVQIEDYDLSKFTIEDTPEDDDNYNNATHLVESSVHSETQHRIKNNVEPRDEEIKRDFSFSNENVKPRVLVQNSLNDFSKEYQGNTFVYNYKKENRTRRRLLPISLILILLSSFVITFVNMEVIKINATHFFTSFNDYFTNTYNSVRNFRFFSEQVITKPDSVFVVSKPVVLPSDTARIDSLVEKSVVDSLQLLFDNPRVFTEYYGTERLSNGNRLARLAERYYGKSDFWVYIYEANRDKLKHPNAIPSGTEVKIPKVDARLIDASNPRCIEKARELHDLYIAEEQQ